MTVVDATNCHRPYAAKDADLSAPFASDVIDFRDMPMGTIQVHWVGATGTLDGVFKIYASLWPDPATFDPDGTEIDCSSLRVDSASGSRIWVRDRLAFRYAMVRWFPGGTTGGVAQVMAMGKKS